MIAGEDILKEANINEAMQNEYTQIAMYKKGICGKPVPNHKFKPYFRNKLYDRKTHISRFERPMERTATIFFLHGLNCNHKYEIPLLQEITKKNENVFAIFVQADNIWQKASLGYGPGWFSYYSNNEDADHKFNFLHADNDLIGTTALDNFADELVCLIEEEAAFYNSYQKIFMVGVSQGGNLACHTALKLNKTIGGIILWRSLCHRYSFQLATSSVKNKIVYACGYDDTVYAPTCTYRNAMDLSQFMEIYFKFYDVDHYSSLTSNEDLNDISNFIIESLCNAPISFSAFAKIPNETLIKMLNLDHSRKHHSLSKLQSTGSSCVEMEDHDEAFAQR